MKTNLTVSEAPSAIINTIAEGLLDENCYYHCTTASEWETDSDRLLTQLAKAKWLEPDDEPIPSSLSRGISHFADFKAHVSVDPAIICCYGCVNVNREVTTATELNTHHKETETGNEKRAFRISLEEYKKILGSYSSLGKNKGKQYPDIILSVKDLPNVPKCTYCKGTGKTKCVSCYGIGNGECPDCHGKGAFYDVEPGKKGFLSSVLTSRTYRLEFCDPCPSCGGKGYFKCKECGETGLTDCSWCHGSGTLDGAKSAQKVKRLKETYYPYIKGELYLPDDESMDFDAMMLRDDICKMSPTVFNQEPDDTNNVREVEGVSDRRIKEEINGILDDSSLVGASILVYRIPDLKIITFNYDGEEYRIIVIGQYAFAKELPSMSTMENLFGTYKKKVK